MFFRRVENRLVKFPKIVENIIERKKFGFSLQEFKNWIKINRVDFRNYIRLTSVRKLFVDQLFGRG